MSLESTRPIAIADSTDETIEKVPVEDGTPANAGTFMTGVSLEAAFLQSGVCLDPDFSR